MSARFSPAILERTGEGLTAFFPDFPGCVAAGETVEAVTANAEAALSLHIAGMVEDGDAIPEPSRMGDTDGA
ncbi:MAG TPA: type II toxin-antitoxin system HicB family antitoxin [Azospirillum sp.]|nr:type II toxin-antitoxin system HicB family antitoxin [Azospirillum sp.]